MRTIAFAAVVAGIATSASAQTLTIEGYNSSGQQVSGSPWTTATVALPSTTHDVRIYVQNGNSSYDAPRVTLTGGNTNDNLNISIGNNAFAAGRSPVGNPMVCRSWAGLDAPTTTGQTVRLEGRITGNLTGTIVDVDQVGRFDVDGDVDAHVDVALPLQTTQPFFIMWVGSITANGHIHLANANITEINVAGNIERPSGNPFETTSSDSTTGTSIAAKAGGITLVDVGGDIRGDIVSRRSSDTAGGRIGSIICAGHIGRSFTSNSAGDPDSSTTITGIIGNYLNQSVVCIEASRGIGLIQADTMTCFIEADRFASTDTGLGVPQGSIEGLVTTGTFKGSIKAKGIEDNDSSGDFPDLVRVDIGGNYRARTILGATVNRTGVLKSIYKIGGSVLPVTIEENLPTDNVPDDAFQFADSADILKGQVIINANNNSSTWSSPAVFHSFSLSSATYSQTPSQIGGGSIGLAPFRLHESACVPVNNAGTPTLLTSYF